MIVRLFAAASLVLTIAASGAHAAERHRERHASAAPAPPAEAARLMAFRGAWRFDGTVTMGRAKPRNARWRMTCKESAGGWALVCDTTMHLPRMPVMREHDLFGYDAAAGSLHFYAVNNMGEVSDILGKWVDERTIHYRHEASQNGKPLVQEAEVILRDADTFDIDTRATAGGEPQITFHGTFHKVPPRARRARHAAEQAAPAEPAPAVAAQ